MKTITELLRIAPYTSKIFDMYFGGKGFAVFDIETTGLSPSRCSVILSGILLGRNTGDSCEVIQFFADSPDDEKIILEKTRDILRKADFILTYNGRHFDIPFVKARAAKYGIDFSFPLYNLDLFQVLQGHSPLREYLPDLKQKTVEIFMGLSDSRDDEISGAESIALYERYLKTGAFALEKTILLHNRDDLIQLCRLLPVIEKADFHRAMYKLGFPAGNCITEKIHFKGRNLCALGVQTGTPSDYISFPTEESPCSLTMSSADLRFELSVPCSVQSGAMYFDARALLPKAAPALERFPSVVDGFLIASEGGNINYMEINGFLLEFLKNISSSITVTG